MATGRVSKAMLEHLRYIWQVYSLPNAACGRPTHYENLRTHDALLRRGLIREEGGLTMITEAGIRVLAAEIVKNATEAQKRLQPREERLGGR